MADPKTQSLDFGNWAFWLQLIQWLITTFKNNPPPMPPTGTGTGAGPFGMVVNALEEAQAQIVAAQLANATPPEVADLPAAVLTMVQALQAPQTKG